MWCGPRTGFADPGQCDPSQDVMNIFFVCSLLASAAADLITCGSDKFCSFNDGRFETPSQNVAVATVCTYSTSSGLNCPTTSFYVVVDGFNSSVALLPSSSLYLNSSFRCEVPNSTFPSASSNGTGVCGFVSVTNFSTCTSNEPGCQAFRFALKPSNSVSPSRLGENSSIPACFSIIPHAVNQSHVRCLEIQINIAPSEPMELHDTNSFQVYLGQTLSLRFSSSQWIPSRTVSIDFSLEIKSSPADYACWKWQGPTFCTLENSSATCPRLNSDNWARELVFRPGNDQNATKFNLTVRATTQIIPENATGTVRSSFGFLLCS